MNKISNVPKIRFKGFTDAWEQRKLGELVQFVNGRAYKQEELLDVGKYKVVRVGNFNTNEKWYFSDLELETDKYMDNGDLLYLWATSFGPVIWQEEKAIFHYHIWKLKNFESLDKKYLYSFLEWDKNKISQNTNGSTMVHITKNMIEQRDIEYPTKSEQYRIGSLLESVDNLITLHQRKYNQVVNFKKAMLEKMFPKNGSDTPEIRFKGYTDAWEQRELGTMITVHPSKDLTVEAIESEGTSIVVQQGDSPILGYSNAEGFEGYINVTLFGDHTVSLYKPQLPFVVATDGVKILSSSILHHQYFYTVLEKYKPIPQGYKRHFSILKEQIANITVNKDEQKKIGEIFEIIDDLITLHQRKLQQLKHIKKAMLEKMFV